MSNYQMRKDVKIISKRFKFYNPERKNKFLYEQYPNEDTRNTYGSLFQKVSYYEEDNKKDLCDFSFAEATDLMIGLMKRSQNALDVAHSVINTYINWCLTSEQNYSITEFNSFELLDKKDKQRFVHKVAQKLKYITRDEMYEKCGMLYNYIDKAMVCLIFEGVKGRPDRRYSLEELRNLKRTDIIPKNNTILLTRFDENNIAKTREFTVAQRTMDILVVASKEEIYHKENGESRTSFAVMELKDNPYLFRTGDSGGEDDEDDRMKISSINSRFKIIRKYTNSPFLNPTNLFYSGLFERCELLEKQHKGKLMVKHYGKIYEDLFLDDNQGETLKLKYENYKKNKAIQLSETEHFAETERKAIVQSRIGQGKFRTDLIKYWGKCSVTGCELIEVLKASHIKPWRNSDNIERLDVFNGLLLIPNLDSAFDNLLISFDNEGNIIISDLLNINDRNRLGIHPKMRIRKIEMNHVKYFEYHRQAFFERNRYVK